MRIAIMQPYFFPYIGYIQLVSTVNKFIFLDDVSFINKGWINRNNILLNGTSHLFTVPLKNASQNFKINSIELAIDQKWLKIFYKTVEQAYKKAPYYEVISTLIKQVFEKGNNNIAELAKNSIINTASYLQLKTEFVYSSSIYKNEELKGEERILDICKQEKTTEYINAEGGKALYDKLSFSSKSIDIKFIKSLPVAYSQSTDNFTPWLSIIDVMMFNSPDQIRNMLSQFELL